MAAQLAVTHRHVVKIVTPPKQQTMKDVNAFAKMKTMIRAKSVGEGEIQMQVEIVEIQWIEEILGIEKIDGIKYIQREGGIKGVGVGEMQMQVERVIVEIQWI